MQPKTLTLHVHRQMMEDGATLVDLGGRIVRLYEQNMTALSKDGSPLLDAREAAQLTRLLADLKACADLLRRRGV